MLTSVILANLVVGGVSIVSACFNWVRSREFGIPGTVLSIIGLILIGMSVWASAEFGASRQGVKSSEIAALQRSVDNANVQTVARMKEDNKELADQIEQLSKKLEDDQNRIFSDIQAHILAIRTALTERPTSTQQSPF